MAANLAGMFSQLNNAIGRNPLVTGSGQGLIDSMSQNLGTGIAAGAGMMGQQVDPYSFMNQGGKEKQGQQELAKLNLENSSGMSDASKIFGQMGNVEQSVIAATQAKEMKIAETKQVTAHAQKAALLDIIKKDSSITQEERDYYNAATTNGSLKTRADYLNAKRGGVGEAHISSTGKMVKDSEGNYYNMVVTTDKNTLEPTTRFSVIGTGPEEPVGAVTPISSTTGLSGADTQAGRLKLAGVQSRLRMTEDELKHELKIGAITHQQFLDIKKAKAISKIDLEATWQTERNDIVMNIPNVLLARNNANKALSLLDTQSTSGVIASIESMKDFFGLGDTSTVAELNQLMSQYILDNLRKMGANPTEGERAFLINSGANIGRGTEANVALFQKTLERIQMNAEASEYLLDNPAATRDEYVKRYNSIIETRLGTIRIKLGDMK